MSYTIDAHLNLHWTNGALTTATVATAQISIVDQYDFNLDDLAMVPLPAGITMPDDLTVAPLPAGISVDDLPIPEEVVQTSITVNGQEWVVVKDEWLSDIAFSGGAVNYPLRIEAFAIRTSPVAYAITTAWVRSRAPSLRSTAATWLRTVSTPSTSRSAMIRLDSP